MATKPTISNPVTGDWPADGLETVLTCPVCGSNKRQLAYAGLTDRIFYCAPGSWNLYRCEGCNSAYLDPRPTLSSIGLAYSNYYTHSQTGSVDSAKASWWRQWRIAQRNLFLNKHYGYDLKPAAKMSFFLSSSRQRRFYRYTGQLRFTGPGARLLDIGCGNGSFLRQMRSLGWQVCGIEPDSKSAEQAQAAGLDVRIGLLAQFPMTEAQFDAITLFHVIEHLHNPMETLQLCWKLLKPGGQLVILTPNYEASGREYFGPDWRGLEPPRHLVLFNEKSLWAAMERCGYGVSCPARPSLNAKAMYRMSSLIRHGGKSLDGKTCQPWFSRLQNDWQAFKTDLATRDDPRRTEELILLGIKR